VTPTNTATFTPTSCVVSKPILNKPPAGGTVKKASVRLDWLPVPCVNSYRVKLRDSGGIVQKANVTLSKYITDPLEPATEYQFRVVACNEFGCERSEWRRFITAETLR
jgi:hypothetical protein